MPSPLRVLGLESRRRDELAALITRQSALPTVAPSMQEVPLTDNQPAFHFATLLLKSQIHDIIFLTGVGTRALVDVLQSKFPLDQLVASLNNTRTIVRGPKPLTVLRELGIRADIRVPEPNTWRDLIAALDATSVLLQSRMIAIQEYGKPNPDLDAALRDRGASVLSVPVYRWTLPDDLAPLKAAIHSLVKNEFDVVMFTSAQQAVHLLEVADQLHLRRQVMDTLNRTLIASIGPTASETLISLGLNPDFVPSHPKMGHLVVESLAQAPAILAAKRVGLPPQP